jgi:nucleoside-diphosphate-sugar epimerase
MPQKISVVTGGGGFLGSHLTDRLLAEGLRGIAIDNHPPGLTNYRPNQFTL